MDSSDRKDRKKTTSPGIGEKGAGGRNPDGADGSELAEALSKLEAERAGRRKAELALRESEERYRTYFDNAIDGIFQSTPDGRFTSVNPAMARMFGYAAPGEMIEDVTDIATRLYVNPADRESLKQRLTREDHISNQEYELLRRDGSRLRVSFNISVVRDSQGKVLLYQGTCHDITLQKEAEAKLRESEERIRSLVENVSDVIYETDADGRVRYINPGVEKIIGYTRDEIMGRHYRRFLPPEHAEEQCAFLRRLSEEKIPSSTYETPLLTKDGRIIWLWQSTNIILEGDNVKGFRVIARDITERKRSEAALRESEERLRELVENASDLIYEADAGGNLNFLNPTAERLLGYTAKEIMGRHYLEFIPPEHHEQQARLLGLQFVKKRRTVYHETPVLTRDGLVLWMWQSVNLILEGETVKGFRVIARDITDRKKAEEALKESEGALRAITASARDAIIMIDDKGSITFWNEAAEEILGWTRDEVLGRDLHLLLAPEGYHDAYRRGMEFFGRTGRGGAVGSTLELTSKRKDGAEIPVELSLSAVQVAGSWHAVGIMRDITERKRSEAERMEYERRFQQSQKLESLGVLAGGIAHDFNNLLMGVVGNLELSILDLPQDSRTRKLIEKAMSAGRRAADLTRQMLAYSGKGRYVVGRVNLSDLILNSEKLIRAAVPGTSSLDLRLDPVHCVIEADADQVRQVVMNLVTNAAEAVGEEPGTVTISTGVVICDEKDLGGSRINERPPAGEFVFLEVSDTGCGMDADTLQRIFEPFFTTRFTGRGLGMSAVLGIVGNHGGAIFTDSTPGRGTTVRVLFPLSEAVSHHEAPQAEVVPGTGTRSAVAGTVLVVDDEEDVREVCSVFVEHLGFNVITAADGEEALRLFGQNADKIVCVLLDLTMPRRDGISTFRAIREISRDMPVILSSGYSDLDISRRFSTLGLAGFIQKPYTLHELEAKITRALSKP